MRVTLKGLRDWGIFRAEGALLRSVDHCGRRFRLLFVGPGFRSHRIAKPCALPLRKHDCRHRVCRLCFAVGGAQLVHVKRTGLSFALGGAVVPNRPQPILTRHRRNLVVLIQDRFIGGD